MLWNKTLLASKQRCRVSRLRRLPPTLITLLLCVMEVTEPPRWHLAPVLITPREGVGVILQDPDPIPPVMPIEVRAQAVPRTGGYQASGEGARALLCHTRKAHFVQLGLVYCLADRHLNPIYCGLSTVHAAAVCRHGPRVEFQSTLQAQYPPSESHLIRFHHYSAQQCHGLLQNPRL